MNICFATKPWFLQKRDTFQFWCFSSNQKLTVGNWSRSKMQWWSLSLYDLQSIFLSTSLNPKSFYTHSCFQRNRFPAEWCVASCPPNETRKSSLSVLTGATQGFLRGSMMSINWPPTWMELSYLFRSLCKCCSLRNNVWALAPGAEVRQIYHTPPPQKPPLSTGTLPKDRWMLYSPGPMTTASLPIHRLLPWRLSTGHLKCY